MLLAGMDKRIRTTNGSLRHDNPKYQPKITEVHHRMPVILTNSDIDIG